MCQHLKSSKCESLKRVWLFVTEWTGAHQAPLSMEFSRHNYWSGLPFPSPGDLSNQGIEPGSPALQVDSLPSESPRKLIFYLESLRSFPRTYMWLMTERQARCLIFNIMAYVSSTWIKHYFIQQVFTSYLRWDPNSIMPLGYKQWM